MLRVEVNGGEIMQKLLIAVTSVIALLSISTVAQASRHPNDANLMIDVAARPSYPEAVAVQHRRVVEPRRREPKHHAVRERSKPHEKEVRQEEPKVLGVVVKAVTDAAATTLGAMLGIPDGWADGMSEPRPIVVKRRPDYFEGQIDIAGIKFDFGSGGYGRGSIPYGDHPITPEDEGGWGRTHGALGLNGDEMYDSQLGSEREGIELHSTFGRGLKTAGCVKIEQWSKAKAQILAMINKFGHAFLHVWPGAVSITPERSIGRTIVVLREEPVAEPTHYAARKRRYNHEARRWHRHHEHHHYAHARYRHYARA